MSVMSCQCAVSSLVPASGFSFCFGFSSGFEMKLVLVVGALSATLISLSAMANDSGGGSDQCQPSLTPTAEVIKLFGPLHTNRRAAEPRKKQGECVLAHLEDQHQQPVRTYEATH
jgi:hypothetical protein